MENREIKTIAKELQFEKAKAKEHIIFHGKSMRPFLIDGDELAIWHVSWDEIKPGDIITYRFEDKFPTRRVMRKKQDTLVLKADSWPHIYIISRNDILGKAVLRKRNNTFISCRHPFWIAYTIRALYKYGLKALKRRINSCI